MTSHLAGLSVERVVYQSEMLCGLLSRFLEGEAMERGVCNPQVWDCPAFEGRGGTLYGWRRADRRRPVNRKKECAADDPQRTLFCYRQTHLYE